MTLRKLLLSNKFKDFDDLHNAYSLTYTDPQNVKHQITLLAFYVGGLVEALSDRTTDRLVLDLSAVDASPRTPIPEERATFRVNTLRSGAELAKGHHVHPKEDGTSDRCGSIERRD